MKISKENQKEVETQRQLRDEEPIEIQENLFQKGIQED